MSCASSASTPETVPGFSVPIEARKRRHILAVATNPESAPSTRFRVLQWRSILEQAGFSLSLDSFYSSTSASILYQPGHLFLKSAHFLAGSLRRGLTLKHAAERAELLLIHREAFPLGRRTFFRFLRRFPGPIIYDYDDAMFLPQRQGRGLLAWLEDPNTPREVMRLSRVVFAGNELLADYARRYAPRVMVVPTCVDTDQFCPSALRRSHAPLTVGWIGTHTAAKYLLALRPALEAVAKRVPFRLLMVGNPYPLTVRGAEIVSKEWGLASEVQDFRSCDVGLYPLWDDPWARGKCGLKGLQFMACGVPMVASAVGVNREIIQEGRNGFLASSESDWIEKVVTLLSDPALRQRMGHQGRLTVLERYSLRAHASQVVGALQALVGEKVGGR